MLQYFQDGANLLILALGITCIYKRRADLLIHLVAFGLSIGLFNTYRFGMLWTPVKVASTCCLLFVVLNSRILRQFCAQKGQRDYLVMLGLCMICSLVVTIPLSDGVSGPETGLRGTVLRPLVNAYHYASFFCIVVVAVAGLNDMRKTRSFFEFFIGLSVVESLIAWFQFALVRTGRSFVPIPRLDGKISKVAGFNLNSEFTHRLYAFAGEPKQLAAFLLPAVTTLLILAVLVNVRKGWARYVNQLLLLMFPVIMLTHSTAAIVAVVLSVLATAPLIGARLRGATIKYVGAVTVIFLAVSAAYNYGREESSRGGSFVEVLRDRSVKRLEAESGTRLELRTIRYMINENPASIPFGLGPGMYAFHLHSTFRDFVQQISSGWITLFADLGLCGVLCVFSACWYLVRQGSTSALAGHGDVEHRFCLGASVAALIGAVTINIGTLSLPNLALFVGIALAAIRSAEKSKRRVPLIERDLVRVAQNV